jgi:hypothetical protein
VRIAEAVLANLMLQEMAQTPASLRILPEEHFEFQGVEAARRGGQRNRAVDGS